MVEHFHLEFIDNSPPTQKSVVPHCFNKNEIDLINKEIEILLLQNVIEEVDFDEDQFISPIFLREKKNGEFRHILNLKKTQ